MTTHITRRSLLGLAGAGAGAALLGACGNDDGGSADGKATIEWWHISNTDPMLSVWAELANAYMAQHPDVKINITPLENQAFKSKLTTVTQSGKAPSLFSSWGGGVLKQQVEAGLVKDISGAMPGFIENISPVPLKYYQVDGKQYALPFDNGMVGFWYNKDLFAKAGIAAPPQTWGEFLEVVRKLKASGTIPIALGGKEKWPAHFYFSYLVLRIGGADALEAANAAKDFRRPEIIQAGQRLKELVDLEPFQPGFLGATYPNPDGQAALVGNGKAAMELMGQWAPSTQAAYSTDQKGQGDKIAFFPFPAVEGGAGKITDVFGGGNGFAIGHDAPEQTVDFLKFLLSLESQRKGAATNSIIPVAKGAEEALTDANQKLVAKTVSEATGFQLYLDQAWAPAIGEQINASVTELIAGKASPEQVAESITNAAKR
ncbi:extracellular solute-binding protein [Micromonospora sp. HM5-17]|jgi:raffinose/stachyose/melibiose transport system substrate-binding protein|uniref:extracellular solute-binding protein n=1 Tax=Micromonospora sp. HM5-17 TaxID=2487710 RepID=UPI000F4990E0|nr:extracellular solute-binding protein [Micromonospora sp. HM5-17]ROT32728.1 extracellular solute-binding protein [Micromonospora sp. HM5-17]